MGAYIILKYLENNSAPGAVILAPIPICGTFKIALQIALINPRAFMKFVMTRDFYSVIGTPQLAQKLFFSADIPEDQLQYNFSLLQTESLRACLDTMLPCTLKPTHAAETPFLFLGATNDKVIHPPELANTAKAYGAQAEFFPGIAHDLMLDADWKSVAARIHRWLRDNNL